MISELKQLPREIHKHIRARSYIGSSALGVSDGLVTNLAFLSGFAGAASDSQFHLIQIAGVASMLAGAISMFFGGVLAGRSEYELFQRSEEHTSELQSPYDLVCRLLLEQ